MKMKFEDYLAFVARETPATSNEKIHALAEKLMSICQRTGEGMAVIWNMAEYWE